MILEMKAVKWILQRKRGEVFFLGLALCFLFMSIYAFAIRMDLREERLTHSLAIVDVRAKLNQVTLERDEYKRSFEQLQNDIKNANKKNAEAFAVAQKENSEAMAQLRAAQIQAEKGQINQLKVIKNDVMCQAHMDLADVYCKGMGDL